jgi:hypothetical protein
MKPYEIRLNEIAATTTNVQILRESQRKYLNVVIDDTVKPEIMQTFLGLRGTSIKSIKINECEIELSSLQQLLTMAKDTVTEVALDAVELIIDCESMAIEMGSLRSLRLHRVPNESIGNTTGLFKFTKIQQLSLDTNVNDQNGTNRYNNFLTEQPMITGLSLYPQTTSQLFQSEDHAQWSQNLGLKSLVLSFQQVNEHSYTILIRYISSKHNMKRLDLWQIHIDAELLRQILRLELHSLELGSFSFHDNIIVGTSNYTIRKLGFFSGATDDNTEIQMRGLIRACRGLREVHFQDTVFNILVVTTLARYTEIDSLYLWDCRIFPSHFPHLRKLVMSQCTLIDTVSMLLMNWRLEELVADVALADNEVFNLIRQEVEPVEVSFL